MDTNSIIEQQRLIAILRSDHPEKVPQAVRALVDGGIRLIEVTFTMPDAAMLIHQLDQRFGSEITLGAGTILDPETARTAILAGAKYIISPHFNAEIITMCRRYSTTVIPGAFTATEVVRAWEAGADFVKIFPVNVVGAKYLKALKGPLPQVRMIPTGGVDLETMNDYFAAGASAVGLGGGLLNDQLLQQDDFAEITQRANAYVERLTGTIAV